MPDSDDIKNALTQAAVDGVASSSFSPGSSSHSAMSVRDQIEAIRFLREEESRNYNHGGIQFRTIQPPGALNDQ